MSSPAQNNNRNRNSRAPARNNNPNPQRSEAVRWHAYPPQPQTPQALANMQDLSPLRRNPQQPSRRALPFINTRVPSPSLSVLDPPSDDSQQQSLPPYQPEYSAPTPFPNYGPGESNSNHDREPLTSPHAVTAPVSVPAAYSRSGETVRQDPFGDFSQVCPSAAADGFAIYEARSRASGFNPPAFAAARQNRGQDFDSPSTYYTARPYPDVPTRGSSLARSSYSASDLFPPASLLVEADATNPRPTNQQELQQQQDEGQLPEDESDSDSGAEYGPPIERVSSSELWDRHFPEHALRQKRSFEPGREDHISVPHNYSRGLIPGERSTLAEGTTTQKAQSTTKSPLTRRPAVRR